MKLKRDLAITLVLQTLPFKSTVVASRNDPLASFDKIASLAASWNAQLLDAGEVGRIGAAQGYVPAAGRVEQDRA